MALPVVRAILFDLDGTLLDSFASHLHAYRAAFSKVGLRLTEDEFHRHYHPDWNVFYQAAGVPPEDWGILSTYWRDEIAATPPPPPFPGVTETLAALRRRANLAVVTSGSRHRVDADLKRAGLAGHFEVIITGGDVSKPKPEPEGILLALRALAVTPEEAVYVGDTPVDEAMAAHAGVRFVGVKSAFTTGRFRGQLPPLLSVVALPRRLGWVQRTFTSHNKRCC